MVHILTKNVIFLKSEDDATLSALRPQVANYVNGGHYNPHHDYVMKEREPDHVRWGMRKGIVGRGSVGLYFIYIPPKNRHG